MSVAPHHVLRRRRGFGRWGMAFSDNLSRRLDHPTAISEWLVAAVSSGQGQGEDVAALLREAQADLDALRLTAPAGDNALEKYRKVLELAPDNITARQGLQNIAQQQKKVEEKERQEELHQSLREIIKYQKQKREQQSRGLKK